MTGSPPFRSRERSRALAIVIALLLGSLGLWGIVLLTTGSPDLEPEVLVDIDPDRSSSEPDAGEAGASAEQEEPGDGDADGTADGSGDGGEDGTADGSGSDDGDGDRDDEAASDDDEGSRTTVDLGGGCVVEVADDAPVDRRRPWEFEECDRAPIVLSGSEARWVAVVESLSGQDFSEEEALERLDTGEDRLLLWSSHYPSLNPGLWVIVEGPFDDQGSATDAARRIGGGAYPRALTEDDGDRYCVAADGCVGETRPG